MTDDEKTTNELTVLKVFLTDVKKQLEGDDVGRLHSAFALFRAKLDDLLVMSNENLSADVLRTKNEVITAATNERNNINQILSIAAKFSKSEAPIDNAMTSIKWNWKAIPFSGRASEWGQWWDQFRVAIHENPKIDASFKMKSLSDCLKGNARLPLGSLSLTGENYGEAIKRLLERNADPLILSKSYYDELESLPFSGDISTHRHTLDKIQSIVCNLDNLRTIITIDDQMVVKNITRKFPDEVLRWALSNLMIDYPELRFPPAAYVTALEKIIYADNFIATHKNNEKDSSKSLPSTSGKVLGTLSAGIKRSHKDAMLPCIFCGNKHANADCHNFNTISARKNQLDLQKRCHNCLMQYHFTRDCKKDAAKCRRCDGPHNTAMCVKRRQDKTYKKSKLACSNFTFLQTFTCTIVHDKKELLVRGLLDPGANASYINLDIVKKLNIPLGDSFTFDCVTFADMQSNLITSREVEICLVSNYTRKSRILRFLTVKCIMRHMTTSPPPTLVNELLPKTFDYSDHCIFQEKQRTIEILIGSDTYFDIVNMKNSKKLPSGIALIPSFFGWVVAGSVNKQQFDLTSFTLSTSQNNIQKITNVDASQISKIQYVLVSKSLADAKIFDMSNLQKLWTLETIGIESPDKHISDEIALEKFRKSAYTEDSGRYNVRFPWKNNTTKIPSNFRIAFARLKSLITKSSLEELQKANDHFNNQLKEGIIEIAPPIPNDIAQDKTNVIRLHYLPFKFVFRKGKLRVVYDASAKTSVGLCLNDLILQGLNLTEDLVKLLINFRLYLIGITADIEKAYLQISLNKADRDATRFLWLKDITKPPTPDNLIYLRFARVPFGINASPFLLNIVLQESFSKEFIENGKRNFYVDNFIKSVSSLIEAIKLYNSMTSCLKGIKMNLRDWASNYAAFIDKIPKDKCSPLVGDISILGLNWNREADTLSIGLNNEISDDCTKRNLLKFLGSVYDPLGLFAPCLVHLKILIQQCWKNKYDWDEILPSCITAEWHKIRNEISQIPNTKIPRRYWAFDEPATNYKLHIFCDASDKAFACCAYLLYERNERTCASSLIFSKIRIAPITKLTIPKLELMAVVIGKRTANFLSKNLEITLAKIVVWTDATTVLQWLNTSEVLPPFVFNRINEIKNAYNLMIRYVPSQENPADCASRGKNILTMENSSLWWHGPDWLPYESLWPSLPLNTEIYKSPIDEPPKTKNITFIIGEKCIQPKTNGNKKARQNRKCQRRSKKEPAIVKNTFLTDYVENKLKTWDARVQFLAKIIKFCFIRTKREKQLSDVAILNLAEKLLIIELQLKYYPEEYKILEKGGRPRDNLDLFFDYNNKISEQEENECDSDKSDEYKKGNKIIRCRGRLLYARFPYEVKHPILLPRNSKATYDYINKIHRDNMHIGASHTLAKIRERFWIPAGRALVRSVIYKCYDCKYWEGGSYTLPNIPPIPEIRLRDHTPFLQVGIDFFGPLHIKIENQITKNEAMDVHVLMCTCLVTRAVHLELVPDLSGEQFLLALQRFSSLKRLPKVIISDNATTFTFIQPLVGVEVQIKDVKIKNMINSNRINWYFIPQYAPWFGGAYERLNGLVKRCLRKTYGKVLLTYIELQTVIYEVADIINSRPLIYVSDNENSQPLSPNDLWKPGETNKNMTLEPPEKPPKNIKEKELVERWRVRSNLIDAYWEAFQHLYLLSLRERHTLQHPVKKGSVPFKPKVGDIVLVQEPSVPRSYWKLGRIIKLDNRQAVADLRWKGILTRRSIRQLYPIETYTEPPQPDQLQPIPSSSGLSN